MPVENGVVHLRERGQRRPPCVVDEHIDAAERPLRRLEQGIGIRCDRYVGLHRKRLATGGDDVVDERRRQISPLAIVGDERVAIGGKP